MSENGNVPEERLASFVETVVRMFLAPFAVVGILRRRYQARCKEKVESRLSSWLGKGKLIVSSETTFSLDPNTLPAKTTFMITDVISTQTWSSTLGHLNRDLMFTVRGFIYFEVVDPKTGSKGVIEMGKARPAKGHKELDYNFFRPRSEW